MIVSNIHPIIAREGWPFLFLTAVLAGASFLWLHQIVALILIFLFVFLLYVYRDPSRRIPSKPLGLVSPVDGKVVAIEKTLSKLPGEESQMIRVKTHFAGVYSVRSPLEGKIIKQVHERHKRDSSYINWLQTDEGDNVVWEVFTRKHSNSHCYVQTGERIGQGQRCGFLPFSTYMNLYIPSSSRIDVEINQQVIAGETVLAHLVHNQGASIVEETTKTAS